MPPSGHLSMNFLPSVVYQQKLVAEEYFVSSNTEEVPNKQIVLEEMLLWLANMNPAFSPFRELFDDSKLKRNTAYLEIIITHLKQFFVKNPFFVLTTSPYRNATKPSRGSSSLFIRSIRIYTPTLGLSF